MGNYLQPSVREKSKPASVAHPPGVGEVVGPILGPNRVIAKDVKSCTYDATLIV